MMFYVSIRVESGPSRKSSEARWSKWTASPVWLSTTPSTTPLSLIGGSSRINEGFYTTNTRSTIFHFLLLVLQFTWNPDMTSVFDRKLDHLLGWLVVQNRGHKQVRGRSRVFPTTGESSSPPVRLSSSRTPVSSSSSFIVPFGCPSGPPDHFSMYSTRSPIEECAWSRGFTVVAPVTEGWVASLRKLR